MKTERWKEAPRMTLAQATILKTVICSNVPIGVNEAERKPLNALLRKGYLRLDGSGEVYTLKATSKGISRIDKANAILTAWENLQTLMME